MRFYRADGRNRIVVRDASAWECSLQPSTQLRNALVPIDHRFKNGLASDMLAATIDVLRLLCSVSKHFAAHWAHKEGHGLETCCEEFIGQFRFDQGNIVNATDGRTAFYELNDLV